MPNASPFPRLGRDGRATGESYQAVAAITVVIVCAGLVLSATHFATDSARQEALQRRAVTQGEIFLDALERDPALAGHGQALLWEGAVRVAEGSAHLEFHPPSVKVLALREAASGPELIVIGGTDALRPGFELVERAVLIERSDGTFGPGIARAGVDLG